MVVVSAAAVLVALTGCQPINPQGGTGSGDRGDLGGQESIWVTVVLYHDSKLVPVDEGRFPIDITLDSQNADGNPGYDLITGRNYPTHTKMLENPWTRQVTWEKDDPPAWVDAYASMDRPIAGDQLEVHIERPQGLVIKDARQKAAKTAVPLDCHVRWLR